MRSVIVDIEQVCQDAELGYPFLEYLGFAGLLIQRGSGTGFQPVSTNSVLVRKSYSNMCYAGA